MFAIHDFYKNVDVRFKFFYRSTHIQQLGCHSSHGPFGGSGGRAFNELPDDCEAVVDRIRIRSGRRLDSIQITYKLSNGRTYTGRKYGENGGSPHTVDIRVDEAERIIGVFGKSGRKVDQIGFVTNFGRVLGPYGGNGGSDFRVDGCNLRGIFGRHGDEIDSIGFHCS